MNIVNLDINLTDVSIGKVQNEIISAFKFNELPIDDSDEYEVFLYILIGIGLFFLIFLIFLLYLKKRFEFNIYCLENKDNPNSLFCHWNRFTKKEEQEEIQLEKIKKQISIDNKIESRDNNEEIVIESNSNETNLNKQNEILSFNKSEIDSSNPDYSSEVYFNELNSQNNNLNNISEVFVSKIQFNENGKEILI